MPIANRTVGVEVKTSITGSQQVEAGLNRIETGMNKFKSSLAGNNNLRKEWAAIEKSALDLGSALGVGIAGLGSALVAMGTFSAKAAFNLQRTALAADELAQKTGASVEFISGLTAAGRQFNISQETINAGLTRYAQTLAITKGGTADLQRELMSLANRFQGMADGPEKTRLAIQALGEEGAALIPILNQGAKGIDDLMRSAQLSGNVISSQTVKAAKELKVQMSELQLQMEGFANTIGGGVVPVLIQGFGAANKAAREFFAQITIADAWVKMSTGTALSREELIKLTDAMEIYKTEMAGTSTMTDSMVRSLENTAVGADTAAGAIYRASDAAIAMSEAVNISARNLAGAYAAFLSTQAAAVAGTQKVISSAYQSQWQMYQRQVSAQQRANRGLTDSMKVTVGTAKTIGDTMQSDFAPAMEKAAGAAGGAAKAIDQVSSAQDQLKQRTQEVQGLMGASLEPMNKMQKLQSAYALATGQTSLAQEQMKIAVQGVMKGFDAGSISMSDALGLVLALRNGQIDYTRALQAAGPAAAPFISDLNEFTAAATDGTAKVLQLSQGVDKLPGAPVPVQVDVTTTGMPALDDLHDRVMGLPSEKTVTIKAVVIGLDQLAGDFYNYAPRTGSQPVIPTPGNLDTPAQESQLPQPSTVNVNVDGSTVARATVTRGAGSATRDARRNYRKP